MTPVFLTLDEAVAIHADQVERYGGAGGLRDAALLQSALAAPEATLAGEWLHPTLPEMGAAYLFHVVKNHAFFDGNKRAGLAIALAFLGLNDLELEASDDEVVDLVVGLAEGRISKSEVAVFLSAHLRAA